MNLLYTATSYLPAIGGAQLHHHYMALQLADRHSVQVVAHWDSSRSDWLLGTTLRTPKASNDYVVDGIPVHRLGLSLREKVRLIPAVVSYYLLTDLSVGPVSDAIESHLSPFASTADLIHNVRIGREGISLASLKAARNFDVPFVLTPVHHPRWSGWLYNVFLDIYRAADLVIALTQHEREELIGFGVDEKRIRVTGIGPVLATSAHPSAFRDKASIEGPIVLFIGQHYAYKGYREVLKSAPIVWRRYPETNFVFIGRAVGRSEGFFSAHEDSRIRQLGEVDLQTKTDALAACTVLCVPSSQESFGGVYTEAWTLGKPVIGSRIPAVSEVIAEGEDGLLVPQDPRVIADAIIQLFNSPDQARKMGEVGRAKVKKHYEWSTLARLTEDAYSWVLGAKPDVLGT